MSVLLDRMMRSLHERARHFVNRRELHAFRSGLNIKQADRFDAELLATLASIRATLSRQPNVLIDVGAHCGVFAAAADAFFDLSRIYCFEPDRELHEALHQSVNPDKLTLFDIIVSDQCGVKEFYFHADKSMNSSVAADEDVLDALFPFDPPTEIYSAQLPTSTLDAALASAEFTSEDEVLLKIDTQGSELHVLRGAATMIEYVSSCLVEHIFCSPYRRDYCFEDLVAWFDEQGFICEGALSLSRRKTHQITAVDFLFVRRAT